jgi:hypothetical protein
VVVNAKAHTFKTLLKRGIWQLNYHQGKRLLNNKINLEKMKTHESKTCLLFTYHLVAIVVMQ